MLTLYFAPGSSWMAPRIALREIELPQRAPRRRASLRTLGSSRHNPGEHG